MIFRFSLYGFLKNQRYFEPFLALAFLEKGLSFFEIGVLIGFRELCVNLFEVPSGALADLYGRRKCMLFSFAAYILSFAAFALAPGFWALLGAMLLYALGDAFRTGTHKAMILHWLRSQGREGENTKVYGYTRSWSKIGSAVSALLAAGLVFYSGRYTDIFWFSILPYVANLINLASYPKELDAERKHAVSLGVVWGHLWAVGKQIVKRPALRRLVAESMGFEGVYASLKDYLQPLLKWAALALPVWVVLPGDKRAALLVGGVYFLLYLLSSAASRQAHKVSARWGGEERAAGRLWWITLGLFAVLLPALYFHAYTAGVLCFMALAAIQNVWRPLLVSRFNAHSEAAFGATILSVESQAKSLATAIFAPLVGLAVDAFSPAAAGAEKNLWPLGVLGLFVAAGMALTAKRAREKVPDAALDDRAGESRS